MRRTLVLLGVLLLMAGNEAAAQPPNRQDGSNPPGSTSQMPPGHRNRQNNLFVSPYALWQYYYLNSQPIYVPTPYPFPIVVPSPWPSGPPVMRGQPPAAPPGEAPPAAAPPAAKVAQPLGPAAPPDDLKPKAELQRLLRVGNDYFAEGKYAQALAQYERAIAAAPLEPFGYFHQAQADLALGKYTQAVVAIQRGLRLHPHWQTADFQPRALYRDRSGEFQQHLATLAELTGKNPNDESLLFLLGYQLWFDGKRDEAIVLLRKAATLAVDPTFTNRFLQVAKDPAP